MGIYLGHLPVHAENVALVLNPSTGHVSPQYHVVFDNKFTTVRHMRESRVPLNWVDLVPKSSKFSTDKDFSKSLKEKIHQSIPESSYIDSFTYYFHYSLE